METGTITSQDVITQNAEPNQADPAGEPKVFTQEEVNRIVAKRVSKYADYESLKEKAAKYDEQVEAGKSDLQKATERADNLQAELDALKGAQQLRAMREEVARAKGIPADLLTAATQEECEQQADAILSFAKPQSYPKVPDGGDPSTSGIKKPTREQFAEWLNSVM